MVAFLKLLWQIKWGWSELNPDRAWSPVETVENPENLDPELVEGPKFGGNAGRFDKLSDRFSHFFDSLVRVVIFSLLVFFGKIEPAKVVLR
ncbi:MAG: hypothetical protein DWQ05_14485 [Calditrichaeota bacterium]|nr:MAG: hypothetical protein DWQ05_14485 [Calditrichota bacterium]